jgi:hypothetical protein
VNFAAETEIHEMDTTEVSPKIPATPPANTDIDVRLKLSDLEFSITLRVLMGMTGGLATILNYNCSIFKAKQLFIHLKIYFDNFF